MSTRENSTAPFPLDKGSLSKSSLSEALRQISRLAEANCQLLEQIVASAECPDLTDLRWVSWKQYGTPTQESDCRPVAWPPPPEVLAFWESGFGDNRKGEYCTVVALVKAADGTAAQSIIEKAWMPGVGAWRFNQEYTDKDPPVDRFKASGWSIEMGRWPWRT